MVSVIIPTYNRESSVAEATRSVLEQEGCELEVIVVDDGSTDRTAEVLEPFGSAIRVIRQPNAGVSAARNAGMAAARGEWLAFLDSDDLWRPGKLRLQLEEMRASPPAVVGHAVDVAVHLDGGETRSLFHLRGRDEEYRRVPLRKRPLLEVLEATFFTQAVLLRADVVRRAGGFVPGMRIHEDILFLSRIALEGPFVVSPFAGVDLRRVGAGAASLSSIHRKEPVESHSNRCHIFQTLLEDGRIDGFEKARLARSLSGARYDLAEAQAAAGRPAEARRLRWRSVWDDFGVRSVGRALLGRRRRAEGGLRRSSLGSEARPGKES